MKILFFGDSITDSGRNRENPNDLGDGYVRLAASKLRLLFPDREILFVNRGVGGETTGMMLQRLEHDVACEQPDCVVLLAGINDVWGRFSSVPVVVTEEKFRANYTALVDGILETGSKLILVQPFVMDMEDKKRFRPYLNAFNAIIGEIAEERKLPLIPMDEIFSGATQDIAPSAFSTDGVHPTHRGNRYIADFVVKELNKSIM